jgi:HAD superfamily hydrolase (TIGR01490 family)
MTLAIFDLDNTLIAGDSDHSWGQFLVSEGKIDGELYSEKNDQFYADYETGCLDINEYLTFALHPLTTIAKEELWQLRDKFMQEKIAPIILEKGISLIKQHRSAGSRLLVITSTNRFIAEPICLTLGIEELLATEPEMANGVFTGSVVGIPTYQRGKVERYRQWLSQNHECNVGSYFYSDSINDLPMLLEVDFPVVVDPDEKLHCEAVKRNWEIMSLRD